jgi:iron complex outermembrane receptor protein
VTYSHAFPLINGGRITPWIKLHGEGDTHMTEGNFDAIPSLSDKREAYTTVDLSLKYTAPDEVWFVEAFVQNATDERFQTYFVGGPSPDVPMFTWNAPRMMGIRAAWNRRP